MSSRKVTIALRPMGEDTRGAAAPHKPDSLDDVVVAPVRMFRAEMMADGALWMACYVGGKPNDQQTWDEVRFWVSARKKGVLDFTVTDAPRDADFEAGSLLAPTEKP